MRSSGTRHIAEIERGEPFVGVTSCLRLRHRCGLTASWEERNLCFGEVMGISGRRFPPSKAARRRARLHYALSTVRKLRYNNVAHSVRSATDEEP